eukprot:SAG31_NODE_11_length_38734_cov_21.263854_4_plen_1070_part_00
MKSFLSKRGVIESILNFDAHDISEKGRKEVQKLLKQNAASFQHEVIHRASVAGSPLAAWVKANIQYSVVLEKVAPLEADLKGLNAAMAEAQARLADCEKELAELDARVSELKAEFGRRTAEAEALKQDLLKTQETLDAASKLLGKLDGERSRWNDTADGLKTILDSLPVYALLAASFINYLGNEAEAERRERLAHWMQVTGVDDFKFTEFMSLESERLQWKSEGLPSDQLSLENALVIKNTTDTPYIIDPTRAAVKWLQAHMSSGDKGIEIVNQQDAGMTTALELAVRFGRTLVVAEVDSITPIFFALLRKDLTRQGPRWVVQVGDKAIDYSEGFKLYLVTRNPAPTVTPDVVAVITRVNFSITKSGLEEQLLSKTIEIEQPELEQQKSLVLREEEQLKVQLAELESNLLTELASSQGNLLENKGLLVSLDQTKESSTKISQKLTESKELQLSLDGQRDVYRPLAQAGADMFFILKGLVRMNNMYQYSLAFFFRLFSSALRTKTSAGGVEGRLESLRRVLLRLFYSYVSRSLFKADRLSFSLHLTHGHFAQQFGDSEWDMFTEQLVGGKAGDAAVPDWVGKEARDSCANLLRQFPSWTQNMKLSDSGTWGRWAQSSAPEIEWPGGLSISPFQRLLFLQAVRPDRLESGMIAFVAEVLGDEVVSQQLPSLARVYEETVHTEPVLLITTPGSDPSVELEDFASKSIGLDKFRQVAMGQGQAETALDLLRKCAQFGEWLCLKNVHLVVAWLPSFEKELNALLPTANENFRLWLTTESHAKFPTILLQQSLKITFEAPPGLKKNLQRTYEGWGPEYLEQGGSNQIRRAQLLFVLAWFHAVVQERRKFIPHGWTKFYEFSPADLRSGADIISSMIDRGGRFSWETIHGLFVNAVYGGRIDNEYDVRVLVTYLHQYFNDDMLAGTGPGRGRLAKGVNVPQSGNHVDYVQLVDSLPETDSHSIFGLPGNIDILVQRVNSKQVLGQLRAISRPVKGAGAFEREVWAGLLAPVLKTWGALNSQRLSLPSPEQCPADTPVNAFVRNQVSLSPVCLLNRPSHPIPIQGRKIGELKVRRLS